MMETTYTVKSKQDGYVWQFRYQLNGDLVGYEILSGKLSEKQVKWLFNGGNFPATESIMKAVWMPKLRANFEITVGAPELTFEAFWNAYGNKVGKKKMAENLWNRLPKADKIKALAAITDYNRYLSRKPGIDKAHATTYLNQQYWENEWKSAT